MTRKTGGSAISGVMSSFATMCAPVATAASANGAPIGKIVGTGMDACRHAATLPHTATISIRKNKCMCIIVCESAAGALLGKKFVGALRVRACVRVRVRVCIRVFVYVCMYVCVC